MDGSLATPSAPLLEANQKLQALREQIKGQRQLTESANSPAQHANGWPLNIGGSIRDGASLESPAALPDHLGWGSAALTAVLRRRQQVVNAIDDGQAWLNSSPQEFKPSSAESKPACDQAESPPTQNFPSSDAVKLYPDIGLRMLRQEMTAPGRLWLMLRYLDQEGRGAVRIDIITKALTKKSSELRLCGQRQLRNLLNDGEGVFWNRDKEWVWLYSAAKVAYTLDVARLTGRPVALPVAALLDGIGAFRAHLYAAFHSGRAKEMPYGDQACPFGKLRASSERSRRAMPIARETLEQLSGVGRSSQRNYEERIGVDVQSNFVIGDLSTKENQEERAWAKGQALFELKDYRGQQGKKGKTYLAWQLPNSYSGQHQLRPQGRQKRINRELKDLVMKGMPGNVGGMGETGVPKRTQAPEKIYFPNGKLAAKVYGRNLKRELYWKRGGTRNGRFDLWQQLGDR